MRPSLSVIADKVQHASLVGFVGSLPVSIAVTQIFLGLCWAAFLLRCLIDRRWYGHRTPIDPGIYAYLGACLLATAFSPQPLASLAGLKKAYLMSAVYLVAFSVRDLRKWNFLLEVLISATAASAIWGLVDPGNLPHVTLSPRTMQLTVSGILMMVGIAAFPEIFHPMGSTAIRFMRRILAILLAALLVLTHQISSIIAYTAGCITASILLRKRSVAIAIILTAIMGILLAMFFSDPSGRHYDFRGSKTWSWHVRLIIWKTGWEIIKDRPVTGYGLIDLSDYYRDKRAGFQVKGAADDRRTFGHLHNTPLQVLANTGIIGLSAFLLLMALILSQGFRTIFKARAADLPLMWGVISAQTGFLVNGIAEYNFGDSEVVTIFWVLTGLSLAAGYQLGINENRLIGESALSTSDPVLPS